MKSDKALYIEAMAEIDAIFESLFAAKSKQIYIDQEAELARLRAQVEQLTADAIVRAHRQCIALEALLAIRNNTALPQATRLIAAKALVEIEAVKP